MNAIDCRGLTKTYPGFTLDHLTFTLPSGCILGLVGENGAGKSTAISLLMNAIPRDGGEAEILGTDNRSADFLETRQDIGIVLDEACFPEMLTEISSFVISRQGSGYRGSVRATPVTPSIRKASS